MHSTQLHSRAAQPRRPLATYYVLPMDVLARRAVRDCDPACAALTLTPTLTLTLTLPLGARCAIAIQPVLHELGCLPVSKMVHLPAPQAIVRIVILSI